MRVDTAAARNFPEGLNATLRGTAALSAVISGDTVVLGGTPAAMFALPAKDTQDMVDDKALREMTATPKFRRALVTDGRGPLGQAMAKALLRFEKPETAYLIAHLLDPGYVELRLSDRARQFEAPVEVELSGLISSYTKTPAADDAVKDG